MSKVRYPAFISAWATGKSLCGILRSMVYSEMIPHNLGVIFRKEFVDLRDSTLIDFEKYTNKKVNSQRNVDLKNGSKIMFRHLEEMNNLQNLNLGWFFIEQAEELPTDSEFFLLWGRLRRQLNPCQEFLNLNLPVHTGFIVGNVKGNNWIKAFWKNNPKEDFELTEAITFDNADVLPEDFIKNIQRLKELQPERYRRFVLNDWEVEAEGLAIPYDLIEACVGGELADPMAGHVYVLGSDLAKHRDWTVIIVADKQDGQIVYFDRFQKESWALVRGKIMATAKRYNDAEVIPDSTGVGDPITEDLERAGCRVYKDGDRPGYVFTSRSKEQLIENLIVVMTNRGIKYPRIPFLIDELKEFERTETSAGNVRYSAPQGKHDDCLKKGTLIKTIKGYREVQNIKCGDLILTHKGNWKPVEKIIKKSFKGDFYSIKSSNGGDGLGLELSYNHPIYTAKRNYFGNKSGEFTKRDWILPGDWKKSYRMVSIVPPKGKSKDIVRDNEYYINGKYATGVKVKEIVLTKEFAYFLGLFLAEGCCRKDFYSMEMAFALHETSRANRISGFLKTMSITSKIVSMRSKCFKLVFSSKLLWCMMKECYRDKEKIVPSYAFNLGENLLYVLEGWLDGDGWKDNRRKNLRIGATTSKVLALEMRDIAFSFGKYATIQKCKRHRYGVKTKDQYWVFIQEEKPFTAHWRKVSNFEYASSCKIIKSSFDGDVYNLQVADDCSFVANGIVVHNCVIALALACWGLNRIAPQIRVLEWA